MRLIPLVALLTAACAGDDDASPDDNGAEDSGGAGDDADGGDDPQDTDDPRQGACGDTLRHTVQITGIVHDASSQPVNGAEVVLEERNYHSQGRTWGPGTSATVKVEGSGKQDGIFAFTAEGVVEVERCFTTLLDYHVVATLDDARAERPVNQPLFTAINGDGYNEPTLVLDLSPIPIVLQAP